MIRKRPISEKTELQKLRLALQKIAKNGGKEGIEAGQIVGWDGKACAAIAERALNKKSNTKAPVARTASGYKQAPLTVNMLRSLHHLLAGRKDPKYRSFYMGYWGLSQRGLVTDRREVTDLGRKVALENASVMVQFSAEEAEKKSIK